jgi:hypothetical protein
MWFDKRDFSFTMHHCCADFMIFFGSSNDKERNDHGEHVCNSKLAGISTVMGLPVLSS